MTSPTEGVSVAFYLVGGRVRPARSALNLQISARRNCVNQPKATEQFCASLREVSKSFEVMRMDMRDFCHRLPSVRADCMMVFPWMSLPRVSTARKYHDSRRLYSPSEMHQHAGGHAVHSASTPWNATAHLQFSASGSRHRRRHRRHRRCRWCYRPTVHISSRLLYVAERRVVFQFDV